MAIRMHETHPGRQPSSVPTTATETAHPRDWRLELPELKGATASLRQIRISDAASLLMLLGTEEVLRYIPSAPPTVAGFEEMIRTALIRQREGRSALYAIVPRDSDVAVGIVQLRPVAHDFRVAEWGVALGSPYWGRGLFTDAAALLLPFAFDTLGVRRLEARSRVDNARANAAFQKIGAVLEGVLREAFEQDGSRHDQCLWSILAGSRQSAGTRQSAGARPRMPLVPPVEVVVH